MKNLKIENYIRLLNDHKKEIDLINAEIAFYETKLIAYLSKRKDKKYSSKDLLASYNEYQRSIVDNAKLEKMLSETQLKKVKKTIKYNTLKIEVK